MTQARTCASCANPVKDQDTICKECIEETSQLLGDQASHYADLEIELAGFARKVAENDGGRPSIATEWVGCIYRPVEEMTPEELKRLDPRHRAAAEAIHAQRSLLVSWVRLLVEEDYLPDYPADSIPALACAIESVLSKFRSHEAAGELVKEVRALCQQIVRIIDSPEYRVKQIAGWCPELYPTGDDGQMEPCVGQVEMLIAHDDELPSELRCLVCRVSWEPRYWLSVAERILRRGEEIKRVEDLASKWRKAS